MLWIGSTALAQEDSTELVEEYLFVDKEIYAHPPGGNAGLYRYLAENFTCQNRCTECPVSGKIFLQFYVETDGTLTEFEVLKGEDTGCTEELIALLIAYGPWSPASQNRRPLRAKYVLPVAIHFE